MRAKAEEPCGHHLEGLEEDHHFASAGVDIHLPWDLHHLEEVHLLRPYLGEVALALPLSRLALCPPTGPTSPTSPHQRATRI